MIKLLKRLFDRQLRKFCVKYACISKCNYPLYEAEKLYNFIKHGKVKSNQSIA